MRSTIPRIAHLPGSKVGDDDLVLDADEAALFFSRRAVVSEKTDGISLTVRRAATGELRAGLKVDWLGALGGRVRRAADLWVRIHEDLLDPVVTPGVHVYGEWLWHRCTLRYDALPSAALLYAMRDRHGRMLPRLEGLARLRARGLPVVEPLFVGVLGERSLSSLCRSSAWGGGRGEGVIVEIEAGGEVRWAKWVRPDYRQPRPEDLDGAHNGVIPDLVTGGETG